MRMRWLVPFVVAVLSLSAHAAPLMVSSVQSGNASTGTSRDVMEFAEAGTAAGTTLYSALQNSPTGCHSHNVNNGGWGTAASQRAVCLSVGSGESRYLTPMGHCSIQTNQSCDPTVADGSDGCPGSETCVGPWDTSTLTVGWALHVDTAPSVDRLIGCLYESDGNPGCCAVLTTDRTLEVRYGGISGTLYGESATVFYDDACADDPLTSCNDNDDCVGNCGTCTASTGAECFHGGIELTQANVNPNVICSAWINGRQVVDGGGGQAQSSIANVATWRLGAPGTESGTLAISFDDVVTDDSTRAGFGYVMSGAPARNGPYLQWTDNTCGGTGDTSHSACWSDFTESGLSYAYSNEVTNDTLNKTSAPKIEEVSLLSPVLTPGSGVTVTAVGAVVVGRTSTTSTTRELEQSVGVCTSTSSCTTWATPHVFRVRTSTATSDHFLLDRALWTTAPSGGAWSPGALAQLGLRVKSRTMTEFTRLGAAVIYAFARRPDAPPQITIRDGNLGGDDGLITIATDSDSTNGGTLGVECQGGTNAGASCSQNTYCSQSATADYDTRDYPPGGCTSDAECDACSNNPLRFCADDGDCESPGTCNIGVYTCEESCPGGTCPQGTYAGPGTYVDGMVGADVVLQCSRGGESSTYHLSTARYQATLNGGTPTDAYQWCAATQGCEDGILSLGTCSGGFCTGASAVACSVTADCTFCRCSTTTGTACDDRGDCPTGEYCVFPKPDVSVLWLGYNDRIMMNATTSCTGWAAWAAYCTAGGTTNWCLDWDGDSDPDGGGAAVACNTISDESRCLGHAFNATAALPGTLCALSPGYGYVCTAYVPACRTTSECPASFTCTDHAGGTHSAAGEIDPTGSCTCGSDADPGPCPAGYACSGGVCRYRCTTDANCGSGGSCYTAGSVDVCRGRCTIPCDAWSGGDCTVDTDCPSWQQVIAQGQTITIQPTCVGGVCACCGLSPDFNEATCPNTMTPWRDTGHLTTAQNLLAMQTWLDAQSDSDKRPRLLFATNPPTNQGAGQTVGGPGRPWTGYLHSTNVHLLDGWRKGTFHHVIDMARVATRYPFSMTHADTVHFAPPGAYSMAEEAIAPALQALDTCAQGQCLATDSLASGAACGATGDCASGTCVFGPWASPIKYCRQATGAWRSPAETCTTSCSTSTDSCLLRPCTCACSTDATCRNWYGAQATCVSGECKCTVAGGVCTSGTSDSACEVYGSGYVCTSGVCKDGSADACTASGDACNGS